MKQLNLYFILFIIICLILACNQSGTGSTSTSVPPTVVAPTPKPTSTPTPNPTPDETRFTSPDGYYSFIMPEGWELTENDNGFIRISGPSGKKYTPNLVASQTEDLMMLELWSAIFQDAILKNLGDAALISEDFIDTDEGKLYFRWEFQAEQQGDRYHHIFYMYGSGDWKLVIAYTRLENEGAEYDVLIDAAMRSVQYNRSN